MRKYLVIIACLMIFLTPLDAYRIEFPIFNLSLFRIFVIVLSIAYFFYFLGIKMKIQKSIMYPFLFLQIISLFLSLLLARYNDRLFTIFEKTIMGILICFIFINIFKEKKDFYQATKYFILSYFFYFFFAIYTYYMGFLNKKVTELPFVNIFKLSFVPLERLKGGRLYIGSSGNLQRLSLPTGSPPRLSMFLLIGAIILFSLWIYNYFFQNNIIKRKKANIYLVSSIIVSIMIFLTMSRAGWLTLFFSLLFLYFLWQERKYALINKMPKVLFLLFIVLFAISLSNINFSVPFERVLETTSSLEGHLYTRINALTIWSENLKTLFLGVGLSNFQYYGGAHSHSAYTTVLAERGIIGSIIYWPFYFFSLFYLYKSSKKNKKDIRWLAYKRAFCGVMFVILFGSFLYEFIDEVQIWISLGLVSAIVSIDEKYYKDY
jgi:hypothetical protein